VAWQAVRMSRENRAFRAKPSAGAYTADIKGEVDSPLALEHAAGAVFARISNRHPARRRGSLRHYGFPALAGGSDGSGGGAMPSTGSPGWYRFR
jgi:hypothetical protein